MKISLNILRKFLPDLSKSPGEIAEALTMGGLEVEAILPVREHPPGITGVVTAQVTLVEKHPGADRLSVCEVNDGQVIHRVVCGAPNVKAGMKYPFARIGAKLPAGVEIKKAKIRGIESSGMLLSKAELGISDDHSGIMELPDDTKIGIDFNELEKDIDIVLEVNVTPNRSDCLNHIGIARELSVLSGVNFVLPQIIVKEEGQDISESARVDLLAPEACPRYCGRVISGVKIGESPVWLKEDLIRIGQRSINNIVDATNYVLFLLGQPLHAFDLSRIKGREILIRDSRAGEKLVTIDHAERELPPGTLVIADRERPIALAGVMGGAETEVRGETQEVFLESAWFQPLAIRQSSKMMKLSSESSLRFARGVDPEGVALALDYAAMLILQIAGGKLARGKVDSYPGKKPCEKLSLDLSEVRRVLGDPVPIEEAARIFTSLGFQPEPSPDGSRIGVTVPSFRHDLREPVDLIEEIARVSGYGRIQPTWPGLRADRRSLSASEKKGVSLERKVRDLFSSQGFAQIITYSFISSEENQIFSSGPELRIANPLSDQMEIMRGSLLPGLINTVVHNLRRKFNDLRFFELGRTFQRGTGKGAEIQETNRVAGVIARVEPPEGWRGWLAGEFDLYHFKGILENVSSGLNVENLSFREKTSQGFEPGLSGGIVLDSQFEVGRFGRIAESVRKKYEILPVVFAFELDLDTLLSRGIRPKKFAAFPRHPGVEWDIAFFVNDSVPYDEIRNVILQSDSNLIKDSRLIDLYRGKEQLAAGKKSMAFRIYYLSPDHTLTDEEVRTVHRQVAENLRQKFSAMIRE
ncbi:MAG: phenylalanine--tRNA ligase subunit beta [Proteobacteria bacterium]|nr:phenylalanine--tRNA ligase subunit beta [Pseudomonadota bacterium]